MSPDEQIARLTKWQIALFVPPILLQVLRFVRVSSDEGFGPLITFGRFGVMVLCLSLIGYLQWRKVQIDRMRS
jgi:hypothetical protein